VSVPLHPKPISLQFAEAMADFRRRITKLETRTVAIDSGYPLAALPAVVDPGYTSGDPKVFINGAAALTGPYQHLASYTPAAGDTVLVMPVGALQSYIILGKTL
jgi:hypothetical protein